MHSVSLTCISQTFLDFGVQSPRPIDGPIPFRIAGTVPLEDWTGRKANIAQTNIARGTPVLMRNSVVSRWKALKKWTPEYFRNSVPSWKNISRAKKLKRAFLNFEPNTPMEKVTPWDFWENRESREEYPMSMAKWFDHASNTTDDYRWFFAEEVPAELLRDLSPRHQLKLASQTWVYFGVWMGEGGATTAAHWDMDDNFYVQFYGRKRFLLFPPSDYKRWKSYPRISPNHKQVQMRVDDPSRYSYRLVPDSQLPAAYEAILYPGDMLYIPAYWYHHVEAMVSPAGTSDSGRTTETEHLSISANFWSTRSMPFLIANQEPMPFDDDFDADESAAIRSQYPVNYKPKDLLQTSRLIFLSVVADSLFARGSVAAIARQLCFLRYVDLFGPAPISTTMCPPPLSASQVKHVRQLIRPHTKVVLTGLRDLVRGAAETEFLNMIELSLEEAVPTADVYAFMYNCFQYTIGENPNASTGFER